MSTTRTSLFARFLRGSPKTIRRPKPDHRSRLALTALEARDVPAYVSGGILMIDGTNGADTVTVSQTIPANWYELPKVQVVQNGVTQTFSGSLIRSSEVQFHGNGGN